MLQAHIDRNGREENAQAYNEIFNGGEPAPSGCHACPQSAKLRSKISIEAEDSP